MSHEHKTHKSIVKRLKRANGHLKAIIGMIEDQRSCPEVLQQMSAVLAAISKARKIFLEDHLQSCIADAVKKGDSETALEELQDTLKMVL